jgi:hypothetical protein
VVTDSLFPDLEPAEPEPDPYKGMGRDARRTAKNLERIAAGTHPGTHMPLHTDAATERTGPGLRCRDCAHLYRKVGHYEGAFLKCDMTRIRSDVQSTGPDMRSWWPACTRFTPKEETPDAR